ncbi:MAG TPA: bifunctional serine/threonine-protein kinase/formylglycine-generating enzyme family protein [Chthoniobacteraceae bacterium]|jgi:serine/threonine protein kinase|nr:bifunctional serine/threonine-protein kinase/formylglycine-generating enzyme family protein [Chthoniobacteraceae bacterium]
MPSESDIPAELGPAVRALASGQIVFGRYELRRKLGEGGFGAVWLVRDSALREEVALKFVLQAVAASPEAIDALKAEAARSRRLTHPNIVRIHDFVSDAVGDAHPDLAGISMEYIDGESLAQRRLREPGKCFDVEQIAPWIDQLCQALTYAHDPKRRVIHRDLKPANLLLANDGELKVADFGIACSLINSVTQISGRLSSGTPPFMSPQQLGGDWPCEADDVYALGATIYALLTGTPPFHQGDIVHQVLNKVPMPMHERRERLSITGHALIPAVWEETVAACLAKEVPHRPVSVEAAAQRLSLPPHLDPPRPPPKPPVIRGAPEPIDEEETYLPRRTEESTRTPTPPQLPQPTPPLNLPSPPAIPQPTGPALSPARKVPLSRWLLIPIVALLLFGAYAVWRESTPPPHPDKSSDGPPPETDPKDPNWTAAPSTPQASAPTITEPPPSATTVTTPTTDAPEKATKGIPFLNSLGMKFVPVPIKGRNTAGKTTNKNILFSVWDTRVQDYEVFASATKRKVEAPTFTQSPTHPVVNVTWGDAKAFCQWLSEKEGRIYRLPRDHEWSCAVGIGDKEDATRTPAQNEKESSYSSRYAWGETFPPPPNLGNYDPELKADTFENTSPVGSFPANQFGLFDMSGNVWQWCEEFLGPVDEMGRVIRGGAHGGSSPQFLELSYRGAPLPTDYVDFIGFRCVLELPGR